jgi:2-dehydropantoate 2-reductase
MAACGACYDQPVGALQAPGEARDTFVALVREVDRVAAAMGVRFAEDIVESHLRIMDALDPGASTSMHRDIKLGRPSEIDGLLFEMVRLGRRHGVDTPTYARIAEQFSYRV